MAITYHAGRRLQGTNNPSANYGTKSIDGSYTVLQFTESGVFHPTSSFNVEWLVVAGGGGAAATEGGGGGAGGYRTGTGHGVTAQTYTITVGSGGAGGLTSGDEHGSNGSDSIFDTITSTGGGASKNSAVGTSGGSGGGGDNSAGGGAGNTPSITPITGETTTVQGYAGGNATGGTSPNYGRGGGGGAGAAGGVGTSSATGDGGDGLQNDITGTNIYYAGGGSGAGRTDTSVGGQGGGGTSPSYGSAFTSTMNGTNGLGGGGAGANAIGSNGGSGGSGVVILRFLTSDAIFHPSTSQVGSRFEETDTRKMYHRDDIDFKEENGNEATNYRSASWYEQLSGETP
jgi:hypothetical protein